MPLVGKKCYAAYHGRERPCDPCPTLKTLETGSQLTWFFSIPTPVWGCPSGWNSTPSPWWIRLPGRLPGLSNISGTSPSAKRPKRPYSTARSNCARPRRSGGGPPGRRGGARFQQHVDRHRRLLRPSPRHLEPTDPHRQDVVEIKKAADRATSLTRQLLAFSRKQIIQPNR